MAEDTSPPTTGPKSRLHNLDVGDINTPRTPGIDRRNPRGDATGAETDILKEILNSINKQNSTLSTFIKEDTKARKESTDKMGEDFRALIRHQVGETTGRGQFADIEAAQAEMKALGDILHKTTPQIGEWYSIFNKGVLVQFKNNMREMNENVFRTAQSFSDLNVGLRETIGKTKDLYEMSQTGLIEMTAVFDDVGASIVKHRDSLQSAVKGVIALSDTNIQVIGKLGNNLEEVAAAFKRNREIAAENVNMDRIPFEQQNLILSTMLDIQRRAGVEGTNTQILSSKTTRTEIELLKNISFMTGKTVVEIIKLQEEDRKTLNQMAAAGAITQEQAVNFKAVFSALENTGLGGISEEIMKSIQSGGVDAGLTLRMGESPELAALLAQGNNKELMQRIIEISAQGGDALKNRDEIHELLKQMSGISSNAVFGAKVFKSDAVGILSAMQEAKTQVLDSAGVAKKNKEADENAGKKATTVVNNVLKTVEGLFGEGFKSLGIAIIAQTGIHLLNIGALKANTAALITSSLGADGLGGTKPGKLGKLSKLGKFAKGAGGVAAAGAIGYAIGEYVINPLLNSALEEKTGVKGETLGTYLQTEAYDPAKDPVVFAAAKKAYHERMNKLHTDKMKAISQPSTPVKSSTVDSAGVNAEVQTGQLGKIINLLTIGNSLTGEMADTIGTTGPGRRAITSQGVPPGTNQTNTYAPEQAVGAN